MCGRFTLTVTPEELADLFDLPAPPEQLAMRYNIAPTQPVGVVRLSPRTGEREWALTVWGLIPSWSKDPGIGARMINARFETVESKPAFRKAFAARRCLLPADGYYEWYAPDADADLPASRRPPKQPFFIHPSDGSLLAMAGLYEFWKSPAGAWLATCTIITTRAADAVAGDLERTEIDAFVNHRWLITVRKDARFPIEPIMHRWDRSPNLVAEGVGFLLYAVLDVVIVDSMGNKPLDSSCVGAIRMSGNFGRVPDDIEGKVIVIPFVFGYYIY